MISSVQSNIAQRSTNKLHFHVACVLKGLRDRVTTVTVFMSLEVVE